MTISKKFSLLFLSLMLVIAGFLFAACGAKDYSKITVQASNEYFEMFVGEEKNVSVTIKNPVADMNKEIDYFSSNPEVCALELVSNSGYTTTYTIKGLKGGNTSIDFVTREGAKRTSISVFVKQYSETITASDTLLFLSNNTPFMPSSADYLFDQDSTERGLKFYFYGEDDKENISLEDVTENNTLKNNFSKIELVENHFVISNADGDTFTILENHKHDFAQLNKEGENYIFDENALTVLPGEKFAFVAVYQNGSDLTNALFSTREFTVLADMKDPEYLYGYKINNIDYKLNSDSTFFKQDGADELVLVPGYNDLEINEGILAGQTANCVTAYLQVSIIGDPEFIKVRGEGNENIINYTYLGYTYNSTTTEIIYHFEVNAATGVETETQLKLTLYYEGFENAADANITKVLSVPVSIKIIPLQLLVNNSESTSLVYEFYNKYADNDNVGWKQFLFTCLPEGASYQKLVISLGDLSDLYVRYKGKIYDSGDVEIDDIKTPVYIKGKKDAEVTTQDKIINVGLKFNVIGEGERPAQIKYRILKGAKTPEFADESFKTGGIYLDLHSGSQTFNNLFTDAKFYNLAFTYYSGDDVAEFAKEEIFCVQDQENENKFYLSFNVSPKKVGTGTYIVALDNGENVPLKITVAEVLDSIVLRTEDQNNIVVNRVDTDSKTTYYIVSRNDIENFNFDVSVVAYNDDNSTAIKRVQINANDQRIQYFDADNRNKHFKISLNDIGTGSLNITAFGDRIENFKITENAVNLDRTIEVVHLGYISNFNVYKLSDGTGSFAANTKAAYVNVFTNTSNFAKRTARLQVSLNAENGFGFYDPENANGVIKNTEFDQKYIYWTSDNEIVYNGAIYDRMYNNGAVYEIGGYGTFNPSTQTFYAYSTIEGEATITLFAHVAQFQRTFTYAVNIRIERYVEVDSITLQSPVSSIELSTMKQSYSVVAYAITTNAVNKKLVALFDNVTIDNVPMVLSDGITVVESDEKYQFTINLNPSFIEKAAAVTSEELVGALTIVAEDWLDEEGRLIPSWQSSRIRIQVRYANGTERNPYSLEVASDFLFLKENLSAYYIISDSIDISSISNQLPLGEFDGSIVGKSSRALISGINITSTTNNVGGLFASIKEGAKIEGVSFEGQINIDTNATINVGLVAGVNNGLLNNVGVTLNKSTIKVASGNLGGVVGINNGTISQDFSNISDADLAKTTIFMKDFMIVESTGATNIGGVAGSNTGTIEKRDGDKEYVGYVNYMAYSLIRTTGALTSTGALTNTGALVGESSGIIQGVFVGSTYTAGAGVLVGGEVESNGNVAGAVGYIGQINANCNVSGITARTFVRSNTRSSVSITPKAAIIANINTVAANYGVSNSFAVQAIDDGRTGEQSSMFIVYGADNISTNLNILAFNNSQINVMNNTNTLTYINRDKEETTLEIEDTAVDKYYGDAIAVQTNDQNKKVVKGQIFFIQDENQEEISITPNTYLNNKMNVSGDKSFNGDVYFAFFFKAADGGVNDIAESQNYLDTYVNKLGQSSKLYPFNASREMLFKSRTPNILSIDQNGQITIKNTGIAQIDATSILNSKQSLKIYIYVVNYFDSVSNVSIIYPNESQYSVAFEDTTIALRGNNSASIYAVPNYSLDIDIDSDRTITADKYGNAVIDGYTFNLERNYNVVAEVYVSEENALDFENIGTQTIITKGENVEEKIYNLTITPKLVLKSDDKEYYSIVNKTLDSVKVEYKHGAISIDNKYYEKVPIVSNKTLHEELSIKTTDEGESKPKFVIKTLDSSYIQTTDDVDGLFNIIFEKNINKSVGKNGQGIATIVYDLTLTVNKNSERYLNRYKEDIYGEYLLTITTASNDSVAKDILIYFEQTEVASAVIDNYTSLQEINAKKYMTSKSEYSYPGIPGLLEITINPDDSDFDYILIENNEQNYVSGHASANFGLVAKTEQGENLFTNQIIAGSVTSKGLKLQLSDILSVYNNNAYSSYNGILYLQYDMGSNNVSDLSTSTIDVRIVKGENVFPAKKDLTIKLQNYVNVTLVGKNGTSENDAFIAYDVARGLSYQLNINSYGFQQDNIRLISGNENLGKIEKIGDTYYLNITAENVNYLNNNGTFNIVAVAEQVEGEEVRFASSNTKIRVHEYVVNYDGATLNNPDVVTDMEGGIINLQVGSKITFGIDLLKYIEFDENSNEIVSKIKTFFDLMAQNGSWQAYTSLTDDFVPTHEGVPELEEFNETTFMKYNVKEEGSNYYFRFNNRNVIPVRTYSPNENCYYFVYEGRFKAQNGIYVYDDTMDDTDITKQVKTLFKFNVYTSSSEESPIPIYDYVDFCSMQNNGYYILLNNIELPYGFMPFAGNFKSFDGNGHTITFAGNYDMGSLSEFGLFTSLKENSIIKNLNVCYKAAVGKNGEIQLKTTADVFNFGGLVAENEGSITNCYVYTSGSDYITVYSSTADVTSASYLAGMVASNMGYITNSTVSARFNSNYFVAGFVAQNSGKIAASSFKNGSIDHATDYEQHVAGFVVNNTESGQIITSYVSGNQTSEEIRSKDETSYIRTTKETAGFAYRNSGELRDCYTNISLKNTTSETAGFVYFNGGRVKNCFSLSELKNNDNSSTGFARFDYDENVYGSFENCFYYYNNSLNINNTIAIYNYNGVARLDDNGFKNLGENFAGYSYSSTISPNAVWFYSNGSTSEEFVRYIATNQTTEIVGDDNKKPINTLYESQPITFANGRLELVSPNISVLSIRNLNYSELDETTGNVTYHYIDDYNTPNRGSLHNPILLYSAKNFESDMLERASTTKLNTNNYRIINDIDYSDFEGISATYKITYAGIMEGNGMSISQITMASMENNINGGLFGQIGYSLTRIGVVKNLYISPRQVTFTNTTNVGVFAGSLRYGYLYDVKADVSGSSITLTGRNFVGGIVGLATTRYAIRDAYSNINVTALSLPRSSSNYIENSGGEINYSYAGGIIGFAGKGEVYNVKTSNITSVMGGHVGLLFGGVGNGANVNYAYTKISTQLLIKAYNYGGFIAGEISGNINNVAVDGNQDIIKPFAVVPKVARAVGGIAGILSGGTISNVNMNQSFALYNNQNDEYIAFAGGIVGYVYTSLNNSSSKIIQCVVDADITACSILGGAVGGVNSALTIDGVAVKDKTLTLKGKKTKPYLGGIVGGLAITDIPDARVNNAELTLNNSYCWANLEIDTYTSGTDSDVYVGGLLGESNKKNVKMSYCYTASTINVKAYDSRVSGNFTQVDLEDQNSKVTYKSTTNKIEYTYYLGTSEVVSANIMNNFVKFQTKSGTDQNTNLTINNYGIASYSYSNGGITTEALNNLFAGTFKLKIDSSVKTLNYDFKNDKYMLEGSEEPKPFEKDPNNSDVYRMTNKYTESTGDFYIDDVVGMNRVYYAVEIQKKDGVVVKRVESTFNLEKDDDDNKRKLISSSDTNRQYIVEASGTGVPPELNDGWSIDTGTLIRYDQIRKSSMLQIVRYKDLNGNIYEQDVESDKYVLKSETSRFEFDSIVDLLAKVQTLSLKEIWSLNSGGLTYLAFERNLTSWLDII